MRHPISLILLIAAAGCRPANAPSPPDPPPVPAPSPTPEPAPVPAAADPTQFPFADPRVRDRFRRADAVARRLLGLEATWPEYRADGEGAGGDRASTFRLFWDGSAASPGGGAARGRLDHRRLDVWACRDWARAGGPVNEFRVYAYWTPPGDEWRAWVILLCRVAPPPDPDGFVSVELKLDRPGLPRSLQYPSIHAIERLPPEGAATNRRVGDRDYTIGLTPTDAPWPGGGPIAVAEPHVRRYFASAASFREAALADLDRLERAVRAGVASGAAVAEYPPDRIERTAGGRPILIPSLQAGRPTRPGKGLPAAVKAEALAELVAQIEHDCGLIREHFEGMHAALRRAFPLDEVFAEPDGK